MAFKQGRRPTVVVSREHRRAFRGALLASGYEPHGGARVQREGEVQAWRAELPGGRQVHVQEVETEGGDVEVFAHTEPAGGLGHAVSALTDGASYSGGARVLRADLRRRGWQEDED